MQAQRHRREPSAASPHSLCIAIVASLVPTHRRAATAVSRNTTPTATRSERSQRSECSERSERSGGVSGASGARGAAERGTGCGGASGASAASGASGAAARAERAERAQHAARRRGPSKRPRKRPPYKTKIKASVGDVPLGGQGPPWLPGFNFSIIIGGRVRGITKGLAAHRTGLQ